MIPPIARLCRADAAVTAIFGSAPMRIYPFGEVDTPGGTPYCLWQIVGGLPENFLAGRPDIDSVTVQFDIYGPTNNPPALKAAAYAIRNALELHGYVTRWGNVERDTETKLLRQSFDMDWFVERTPIA